MDGREVTQPKASGAGTVNAQDFISSYEMLRLVEYGNGTFALGSNVFDNVFLRMDGRGVTGYRGDGGGTVNCQYGAREYERFRWLKQDDGTVGIESVKFPGVYLRMNGLIGPMKNGQVNCQTVVRALEKFHIWNRT